MLWRSNGYEFCLVFYPPLGPPMRSVISISSLALVFTLCRFSHQGFYSDGCLAHPRGIAFLHLALPNSSLDFNHPLCCFGGFLFISIAPAGKPLRSARQLL